MNTRGMVTAVAAIFLIGSTFAANAENYVGPGFSGTVWVSEKGSDIKPMGNVHVGGDGFLINVESQGQKISSLVKWDSETVLSIMHNKKMYMEIPPEQSGWEEYEAKACVGYRSGEKQGSETINGRATEKWRCTGQTAVAQGDEPSDAMVWYDPELQFGLKAAEDNGNTFEIRDIEIGAQDASMFRIPAGYQKLDMDAMMQQMMQQQQQQQ